MKVEVGKRLRELRKILGMTQKEFANRVPGRGDYTWIGKIERGHQYPSLELLERIGRTYGVPLGYFFQSERWLENFEGAIKRAIVQTGNVAILIERLQEGLKKLKAELPEPR